MPADLVVTIASVVASALNYAHDQGVLYCDVKPVNIMMTIGTVAYAAPEQLMGDDIDGRVDQYALSSDLPSSIYRRSRLTRSRCSLGAE